MWSVLFMLNAGMRLAAPGVIWAMSFIYIQMNTNKLRFRRARPAVRVEDDNGDTEQYKKALTVDAK